MQVREKSSNTTDMIISLAQGGPVVGSDIGVPRDNVKRTNVPRWTSVQG